MTTRPAPVAAVLLLVAVLAAGCAQQGDREGEADAELPTRIEAPQPFVPETVLDLTYAFGPDTVYWPTETEGFELEPVFAGYTDKGYYYTANRFHAAEHGGTHLDAPIHFHEGGDDAAAIPIERLVGPGIVVDVSEKAHQDPDYQVGVEDLETWEGLHGPLPDGVIVLLRTGFGRFWPDRERYLGTARLGAEAVAELHFPGLHPEAAEWLKSERNVKAVGIDTASIDHGQSTLYGSHVSLFEGGIPVFENVAYLDQVPDKDFLVVALPMKIEGGSGGPLRIIACW